MNNFDVIVQSCRSLLLDCPDAKEARDQLNLRLSSPMQEKFEFGYFPSFSKLGNLTFLTGDKRLLETGLVQEDEETKKITYASLSHHNLVLPYKDVYGNVLALVGRYLLSDEQRKIQGIPKYKNSIFKKSKHLFGLNHSKQSILKQGFAYLVEGQFDVIKAHERGIENIVAVGSSNLSFDQFALLLRYTNKLFLLFDNDEAGDAGRKRAVEKFGKYATIQNMSVPLGFKDVDEFLVETGIDNQKDFESAIKSS